MEKPGKGAFVFSVLLLTVIAVSTVVSEAIAASREQHHATLSGFEEVPAVSSTGQGSLEVKVVSDTMVDYTLTYADLEGTTTAAAHIHLGQTSVNGGVIAFLCGGGGKPACPATAGTVSGTIIPADVIGPAAQGIAPSEFDEFLRALRSGNTYANVHTNKHPGGEIRGQINRGGRQN